MKMGSPDLSAPSMVRPPSCSLSMPFDTISFATGRRPFSGAVVVASVSRPVPESGWTDRLRELGNALGIRAEADEGPRQVAMRALAERLDRDIRASSDRLIALVNNLLDLRRLEEGKIEYNMTDFDIRALTASVVDEMKSFAKAKGLELSLEAPDGVLTIHADQEKIRQVITNLVDNSIKYTEHGFVRVQLRMTNNELRITVSDSGIGIPADLIPNLFEQFNRGSQEAKKIQGTGLGLYIAKMFMLAHKGKVWAESEGSGKGSTFTMELPVEN